MCLILCEKNPLNIKENMLVCNVVLSGETKLSVILSSANTTYVLLSQKLLKKATSPNHTTAVLFKRLKQKIRIVTLSNQSCIQFQAEKSIKIFRVKTIIFTYAIIPNFKSSLTL